MTLQKVKEKGMEFVFMLCACVSILAVALICIFLFANGVPAMAKIGFGKFLLGRTWQAGNGLLEFWQQYFWQGFALNRYTAL